MNGIQPVKILLQLSSKVFFENCLGLTQAMHTCKLPVKHLCIHRCVFVCYGLKFYGPRIGALYVRRPGLQTPLYPIFSGGGQERSFRPG